MPTPRTAAGPALVLALAALLGLIACRPSPPSVDPSTLCALAEEASRSGKSDTLLAELARQTGTPRDRLRSESKGIFAPYWRFFVEEAGIFVARPGVVILEASGDPSFRRIDRCVYEYEVKG